MLHNVTQNNDFEIVSDFHHRASSIYLKINEELPIYLEELESIRCLIDMINDYFLEKGEDMFVIVDNRSLIQFCYDYIAEYMEHMEEQEGEK